MKKCLLLLIGVSFTVSGSEKINLSSNQKTSDSTQRPYIGIENFINFGDKTPKSNYEFCKKICALNKKVLCPAKGQILTDNMYYEGGYYESLYEVRNLDMTGKCGFFNNIKCYFTCLQELKKDKQKEKSTITNSSASSSTRSNASNSATSK